MRNQALWTIFILACAASVVSLVLAADREERPLRSGIREYTSAEVVRLPLVMKAATDEVKRECATRENAQVFEDGEEMKVIAVTSEKLPTLHLILLDTSRSMTVKRYGSPARIKPALLAAKKYVDWLLPGDDGAAPAFVEDAAMVATFDDDLILLAPAIPLTRPAAKSELLGAIDRATGQISTSLAESLTALSRNLPSLQYRTAVIMLSDGADKDGDAEYANVLQVVNATNNLTIFPIGLGLLDNEKVSMFSERGGHKKFLKKLAEATGGRYFDIIKIRRLAQYPQPLFKAFKEIKERLSQEHTIAYASKAFGRGRDDLRKAAGNDFVIRNIEVLSRDRRCKIKGYKPVRYVSRDSLVSAAGPEEDAEQPAPIAESEREAVGGLESLELELVDVWLDSDPLWYMVPEEDRERIRQSLRPAAHESRRVEILLPPLDAAPESFRTVEDVFHHLLSTSGNVNQVDYWYRRRAVHGKTLLGARRDLGWAIYQGSPAYRAWAKERMRESVAEDLMDRLPPEVSEDAQVLDRIVEARLASPKDEDVIRHLAAWRGDLSAKELAARLEREEINRLLSTSTEQLPKVLPAVDRIQANWGLLSYWFEPPRKWRIMTPLVPTYDADDGAFGFYRIILPRLKIEFGEGLNPDRETIGVRNRVSGWPIALQFARWLLALPVTPAERTEQGSSNVSPARQELARELHRRWRVISVDYDDPPPDEEPSALYGISLGLVTIDPETEPIHSSLTARIMRSGMAILDPLCVDESPADGATQLLPLLEAAAISTCSE